MQTRIVFNGHEYSDIEAMPDDVRRAFQDKLAQLSKDADHDGVPDVLQVRGIGIEGAAITINGRTNREHRQPAETAPVAGELRCSSGKATNSEPSTPA